MADRPERLIAALRRRPITIACVAGAVVLVAVLTMAHGGSRRSNDGLGVERTFVVQPRPFASTLNVVGAVVPGQSVEVLAPFDGVVKSVGFEYGRPVTAGQVLLVMDTFEIEQRKRDAEGAYLKAAQAETDMTNWANSPDASRARRAVKAAESDLKITQRKATETKSLLDRGLVARTEYDGLVQQQQSQAMALTAAQEDLATVLKRGEGPTRRVTTIDLQNAKARLADLTAQSGGAVMTAPVAGVIVRPPADKPEASNGTVHAGLRLTRGQLVGEIAQSAGSTGGLGVAMKLEEADANQVSEGQTVTVTGPGFGGVTLTGRISSVASEATASPAGGGASFGAEARLQALTPEQALRIRIGMSANVAITTYQASAAIVVPPQAVQGAAPSATVSVRDPKTGKIEVRPVVIGMVAPDGVEIRSGLRSGEVVVWHEPTPNAPL